MHVMDFPSQSPPPLSLERKLQLLDGSYPYIYQTIDGVDFHAYCFYPDGCSPAQNSTELLPTVVFFHGGHWDVSIVTQFSPHAMHFAKRGMLAIVMEYRVDSLHQASPDDAFNDVQTMMLWLRNNHDHLGADPDRIVAVGAASGAHMALSLAMRKKLRTLDGYSPAPQAVVGISSIILVNRRNVDFRRFPNAKQPSKNNPWYYIRRKLPPVLMIHGKADTLAPHYVVEDFVRAMRRKKNRCELIDFDACNHSFFNFNVSPTHFEITLNSIDAFIVSLGYLEAIEYR